MGWNKDIVTWNNGIDLFMSVVFTWQLPKAEAMAAAWDGGVVVGGPAVYLMDAPWATIKRECKTDVLSLHNPEATFTTRGCVRKCAFCAVPRIEGKFRELKEWKPVPIICDNNILAASKAHFRRVIDSLMHVKGVDFNQGLDARLFTSWHADQICRLRAPFVRFSLDHTNQESAVADVVRLCRSKGVAKNRLSVYVLIGFNDTPDDARYRLDLVRSLGIRPWPMRYRPLDALDKNGYVAPRWTQRELKTMTRYYSRLRWLEHIPYDEFKGYQRNQMDLPMESP